MVGSFLYVTKMADRQERVNPIGLNRVRVPTWFNQVGLNRVGPSSVPTRFKPSWLNQVGTDEGPTWFNQLGLTK